MIRDAHPGDAPEIARVHVASWQAAYPGLIEQSFLDSMDVDERTRSWGQILRQPRGRVLVWDDGVVIGYCSVGPGIDPGWGEVFAIYVHPDQWGAGFGRRLLEAGEVALGEAGHHRALLWVLDGNSRARAFYERQGWTKGRPIRIETIGGSELNEVRYEKLLAST